MKMLTLKAPSKICSRRHLILFHFSQKTSRDISCESFAKQKIHIDCQVLSEKEKCIRPLQL